MIFIIYFVAQIILNFINEKPLKPTSVLFWNVPSIPEHFLTLWHKKTFQVHLFLQPLQEDLPPSTPPHAPPPLPRLSLWHLMQSPHPGGKPSLTARILTPRQAAFLHKWIPSLPPTTSAPYMDTSFPCLGLLLEGIANTPTQAPIALNKLPFHGVTLLILSRL